ncbi:MAG: hypothetical protein O7D86_04555 [Proteobacteria bacterium]|nr:hypothetical protein [Pseudomonadota bacterium]
MPKASFIGEKEKLALPKIDKNKRYANIIKRQARYRLDEFRKYTLEIESKFNSDKYALSNSYDKAVKGLSEDEISEVDDYFSDAYYMIEEIHVGMYRKSTLISIYSFLENSMNFLCRHLSSRHDYPVKLDDLKGDGIVRAKNYLEKLAKVNFDAINGEWSNLMTLNKIRNCIVHSEGDIKASNKSSALENIITNNSSLSLRSDRYVKVEREYIEFCIDEVERFLDKLYQLVSTS